MASWKGPGNSPNGSPVLATGIKPFKTPKHAIYWAARTLRTLNECIVDGSGIIPDAWSLIGM